MKLKVGDQVMVDGQMMFVVWVEKKGVYVHRDRVLAMDAVPEGPFTKDVYREWPVL